MRGAERRMRAEAAPLRGLVAGENKGSLDNNTNPDWFDACGNLVPLSIIFPCRSIGKNSRENSNPSGGLELSCKILVWRVFL